MIRFRHKGCTSEVMRYVGQGTPGPGPGMAARSAEWQHPDCRHPGRNEKPPTCLDCGNQIAFSFNAKNGIEPIHEAELVEA